MKKLFALLLVLAATAVSCTCLAGENPAGSDDKEAIEAALNLAGNPDQEWTYKPGADAWVLSVVIAVTRPVIENEEGVSVCVPGAYVFQSTHSMQGETTEVSTVTGALQFQSTHPMQGETARISPAG